MNSVTLIILLICLLGTFSEGKRRKGKWRVAGDLSYTRDNGWAGKLGVSLSWRRKKRSTNEQVFDVMMYMVNTNTGSRFKLNPCDFALYDQDDDLAVTIADFDVLFSDMDKTKHILVEQLFTELDVDNDQKISLTEFEEKRGLVFSKTHVSSMQYRNVLDKREEASFNKRKR